MIWRHQWLCQNGSIRRRGNENKLQPLDYRVAELGANSAYCHIVVVIQVKNCTVNHFLCSAESLSILSLCRCHCLDFFFSMSNFTSLMGTFVFL